MDSTRGQRCPDAALPNQPPCLRGSRSLPRTCSRRPTNTLDRDRRMSLDPERNIGFENPLPSIRPCFGADPPPWRPPAEKEGPARPAWRARHRSLSRFSQPELQMPGKQASPPPRHPTSSQATALRVSQTGRQGQRLERFAEVFQDIPDRPQLSDERDEPDIAAAAGGSVRTPAVASVSAERPWSRQMPKGCAAAPDRAVQIPLLGTRARVLGIRDRCRP